MGNYLKIIETIRKSWETIRESWEEHIRKSLENIVHTGPYGPIWVHISSYIPICQGLYSLYISICQGFLRELVPLQAKELLQVHGHNELQTPEPTPFYLIC